MGTVKQDREVECERRGGVHQVFIDTVILDEEYAREMLVEKVHLKILDSEQLAWFNPLAHRFHLSEIFISNAHGLRITARFRGNGWKLLEVFIPVLVCASTRDR